MCIYLFLSESAVFYGMKTHSREIFPSVIGNDRIKNALSADFAEGKSAHAYILEGPRGSGKHTTALAICASVVCMNKDDRTHTLPCGKCSSCRKILASNSVDVLTVSNGEKASIGVDAIRKIKESLYIPPNDGEKKFYIIENAHLMTPQAQNALLLSLEEPPPFVMFFLLCEDSSLLLETVKSRAPIIRLEVFSSDFIEKHLKNTLGAGADAERLTYAAHLSGGALGRALELYENGKSELEVYKKAAELVQNLLAERKSDALTFASRELPKSRREVCEILSYARLALRDMIAAKNGGELLFYSTAAGIPDFSKKISAKRITELSSALRYAEEYIESNCSQSTVLTSLILNS